MVRHCVVRWTGRDLAAPSACDSAATGLLDLNAWCVRRRVSASIENGPGRITRIHSFFLCEFYARNHFIDLVGCSFAPHGASTSFFLEFYKHLAPTEPPFLTFSIFRCHYFRTIISRTRSSFDVRIYVNDRRIHKLTFDGCHSNSNLAFISGGIKCHFALLETCVLTSDAAVCCLHWLLSRCFFHLPIRRVLIGRCIRACGGG